jgi:hypothetical protein
METPGASGNATEGICETGQFHSQEYQLRARRATALCKMLGDMTPADAAPICCAYLEECGAGDPVHTAFGDIRSDAAFWADCAHPAELEAYFAASLKRLGRTILGIAARKRLLVALWASLTDGDRTAFLSRINPDAQFSGGAAQ